MGNYVKIKSNLSDIMQKKNMGINTLAQKTGIPLVKLEILFSGEAEAVTFSSLEKICNALEITPDLLLLEKE